LARVLSDAGTVNRIGDAGAQALAEALTTNRTLSNLQLYFCVTSLFSVSPPLNIHELCLQFLSSPFKFPSSATAAFVTAVLTSAPVRVWC
jgi:hypothetical protein